MGTRSHPTMGGRLLEFTNGEFIREHATTIDAYIHMHRKSLLYAPSTQDWWCIDHLDLLAPVNPAAVSAELKATALLLT